MLHSIQINPDTITSDILFFDHIDLSELPDRRIVPLFGANGSGKTTLLKQIETAFKWLMYEEEKAKEEEEVDPLIEGIRRTKRGLKGKAEITFTRDSVPTEFYRYWNSTDNFRNREMHGFDPFAFSCRWNATALSEGQSIVYSAEDLLKGMLKTTKTRESFVEGDRHCVVLLDEIDSGLSLDNVAKLMRIIKKVLKEGRNIQFFLSFNNPYVIHFFPDVISMYDGKVHHMETMEEMMKELKRNQKMLDKARKTSRGKYKIFE